MSNYRKQVLDVNKSLKVELKSFNGAAKLLIAMDAPTAKQKRLLRAILKDKVLYNIAKDNVRKSKSGNISPFFILQFLYKVEKAAADKKVSLDPKKIDNNLLKVA